MRIEANQPDQILVCLLIYAVIAGVTGVGGVGQVMSTYAAGPQPSPSLRHQAILCGARCNMEQACRAFRVQEEAAGPPCTLLYEAMGEGEPIPYGTYRRIGQDTIDAPAPLPSALPASCEEWQLRGTPVPDGTYQVDPDGAGGEDPISVECITSSETLWTTVTHSAVGFINVHGECPEYEPPYSYKKDLIYPVVESQLQALASTSETCQLYLQVHCHHIEISGYAGWYGVTGTRHHMTDVLCPGTLCSCDQNIYSWLQDSGYFTLKSEFPIKQLLFGDLGSSAEMLTFKLGPMECKGVIPECGHPPNVLLATMTLTGLTLGHTATFNCAKRSAFPNGRTQMTLTCLSGGTWSTLLYSHCGPK